jgi:3-dehydroquinate dehydratase-1
MICVSIAEQNVDDCVKALSGIEFAEIRLDNMDGLSSNDFSRIFSEPAKLIATCRPGKIESTKRKRYLLDAIAAGADYVDIEVEASDLFKDEVVNAAKEKKCQVIVSYHNYRRTPSEAELQQVIDWCFNSGADIAKVACQVNDIKNSARLLGLLDCEKKLVVIGMGDKGKMTRVLAPLLGSIFTFASVAEGRETAEGQIEQGRLRELIGKLEELE